MTGEERAATSTVACTFCGVMRGQRCRTRPGYAGRNPGYGYRRAPHKQRVDDWRKNQELTLWARARADYDEWPERQGT